MGLAIAVGGMAFIAASWLARQSLAVCLLAVLAAVAAAPDLSFKGLHIWVILDPPSFCSPLNRLIERRLALRNSIELQPCRTRGAAQTKRTANRLPRAFLNQAREFYGQR